MKTKKRLLFVIESLVLAGSERSCVSLLNSLDSDLYDIDLQLFHYSGVLKRFLPKHISLLPPLKYTKYVQKSWKQNLMDLSKGENWHFFKSRVSYSLRLRKKDFNHPEKAQIYWESVGTSIQESEVKYDVAIAFAQGVPTFYVLEKIHATKKVCWINANMIFRGNNKNFNEQYYSQFDKIVAISKGTKAHTLKIYPTLENKLRVIPNIIDAHSILKMSTLVPSGFNNSQFNILTVGRLNNKMKGMDITIEACKVLKERGIYFHWYIVGEGSFRSEMEAFIENKLLQNHVSLLGTTANPYPYFKEADLYVQTSRQEGYGRTIAEARLLNLPIVTTRYDTVHLQITHEENGLITDMNPQAVADGIERIMKEEKLYKTIKDNLRKEDKVHHESIEKFDQLIQELLS